MKYAKYLASQLIPEWNEHYFKYKKLKKELKNLVRISTGRPAEFSEGQQTYVELLYDELESINQFYETKEKELQEQYLQLKTLLADTWQQVPHKSHFLSLHSITKLKRKKSITAPDATLINPDTSPITSTLLPDPPEHEHPVPVHSEAILPSKTTPSPPPSPSPSPSPSASPSLSPPPPPSPRPENSSQTNPLQDSEIPTPFAPPVSGKVSKRVILAKKYRFAIKRALEEIHRGLGMLKEFAALNSVGFRKIIKKHDKVPNFPSLVYFLEHEVYNSYFHTSNVASTLMSEIETVYANLFTQGNLRQASDKLQIPTTEHHHDWVSFRFGAYMGACAILALYISGKSTSTTDHSPYANYVVYVFRFLGLPVFWLWTFATVMLIWNSVRINYVFIFGWDPRKHMTPAYLYEIAASLSLLWLAAFTGYYNSQLDYSPFSYISGPIYPLVLLLVVIICVLLPFDSLYRSSRWWMFQTIWRILRTPMLPVKFKDFFYTNQFTSLKCAFSDMGDTIYFYLFGIWHDDTAHNESLWSHIALVYRPTLQAYPALLRLLQCLRRYRDSKDRRHLINAGKYTFSTLTVVTSGIRKAFPNSIPVLCIYCLIATVSTFYSWMWDTMMDWDLGYQKHKMLRGKLMYKKPWVYYCGAVLDLSLRAVWAVTLGITAHNTTFSNSMNTIAAICEIIRRFIWNIFRLENEHLKNCNQSNATAIPSLIAAYKQLKNSKSHTTNNNLQNPATKDLHNLPSNDLHNLPTNNVHNLPTNDSHTDLQTDISPDLQNDNLPHDYLNSLPDDLPNLQTINSTENFNLHTNMLHINNNLPNNDNMHDYEVEEEGEESSGDLHDIGEEDEEIELVSPGMRHRHVMIGSEKEQ